MSKQIRSDDVSWYEYDNAYPWHDWFDGNTWLLEPGVDFRQSLPAFRSLAHRMARGFDYRLRTRILNGGLAIQALDSQGNVMPPLRPGA